jgi:two-component system chemotaxis response regulator CheB
MRRGPFQLIVIGASAGGVTAVRTLLSSVPPGFSIPILIVQHIPRDRPSGLVEILSAACVLPVAEAEDKQPLNEGRVLVAPPDYHLLVEDRESVALSLDAPVVFSRPAIDVLFESAAEVFGRGVLAILLTGASTDGSEGIAAVRRAGGAAWIQDPDEAQASIMPAAALAHAGADAVLTVDDMCKNLGTLTS